MTIRNFLKLYQDGCANVSIHQLPYDFEKHGYKKTYFEEEDQGDIVNSDTFKMIANKQVDHFCVIGGGMYIVELCIYLKQE